MELVLTADELDVIEATALESISTYVETLHEMCSDLDADGIKENIEEIEEYAQALLLRIVLAKKLNNRNNNESQSDQEEEESPVAEPQSERAE